MSQLLKIQIASLSELPELYKLERLCHQHPWTLGILKDCLQVGYLCHSFYTGQCEHPIGFTINQIILDECHLLNICIHPKFQGEGYAKAALQWLIELLREKDIQRIFLEVRASNTKAIGLYEKIGFHQVGLRKDYYPAEHGREDALVLQLEI